MTKKIFAVLRMIFLVNLFLLSSCQTVQSAVFSEECAAPCWRNIKPGETHFQDAVDLIKKFPDIDTKDIGIGKPWNVFSNFIGFHLMNGDHIRIYAVNNIVALITFYDLTEITFEECIKEFGKPEYATQFSKLGPGELVFAPSSAQHVWFSAISPKKGVVFGYDTLDSFDFNENTKISELSYFDVKLFEKLYQNKFLMRFDLLEEVPLDKLHAWKGYGNIKEIYP